MNRNAIVGVAALLLTGTAGAVTLDKSPGSTNQFVAERVMDELVQIFTDRDAQLLQISSNFKPTAHEIERGLIICGGTFPGETSG